jgi:hypothetical protein
MHYTGIGSRETPAHICSVMTDVAGFLEQQGFILRSGHADGADLAFENGVLVNEHKDIYLPWSGFNGSKSDLFTITGNCYALAAIMHPGWRNLSEPARKLHARNCYQVLGTDLNTPSKFVLCWTPSGSGSGGTGQALRIAKVNDIPIFDFGAHHNYNEQLILFLQKFGIYYF